MDHRLVFDRRSRTAGGDARKLALGFAASAQADGQLAALGAWLAGKDPPRLDPVTGEVNRATCLAMLPDLAVLHRGSPCSRDQEASMVKVTPEQPALFGDAHFRGDNRGG